VLELFLDESELNRVGLGYEVEVVFDALPDDTFAGTVMQIDPQLVSESGITAVHALIQLDTDSFAKPQTLPVGLNATVEVIGGRAENAVLVPVEALRELSPGEYSLFVMENGEPKLRFVEVGIMDFTFAEILSGVGAGEEVTTGIIQTQSE
jgi:multidrug efflux pump subunit AcrA (membrane-fusion protein)